MTNNRVMVTTTFYNPDDEISRVRSEIAKRTFRNAIDKGCPVIAVDGGSSDELLKEFESYGVVVLGEEQKGMGPARRQAIRVAVENHNAQVTMWAEPEKDLSEFLEEIFGPLENGEAELVNLARKNISSYPEFQQKTECLGNQVWRNITGVNLDMFFGVRAWKRELTEYFLGYNGETEDSIHIPLIDIIFNRHRIKSLDVDFSYPKEQREVEENRMNASRMQIKRLSQLYRLSQQTFERWEYLKQRV